MQAYGLRMCNLFRFGETHNSVVFDILPEDRKKIDSGEMTVDDVYDKLAADPVSYI